jgi:hypothetical protein
MGALPDGLLPEIPLDYVRIHIYSTPITVRGGHMAKRVNANLPDEVHKALRVKLAEDGTNFSDWLRGKVEEYVGKAPARVPPRKRKEG